MLHSRTAKIGSVFPRAISRRGIATDITGSESVLAEPGNDEVLPRSRVLWKEFVSS
jgi:hypothetical protein